MHMHVCLAAVLDPSTMAQPYSFDAIRRRHRRPGSADPPVPPGPAHRAAPGCTTPCGSTIPTSTSCATCTAPAAPHPATIEDSLSWPAIAAVPSIGPDPLWEITVVEGLAGEDGRSIGSAWWPRSTTAPWTAAPASRSSTPCSTWTPTRPTYLEPTPTTRPTSDRLQARRQAAREPVRHRAGPQAAGDRLRATAGVGRLLRRTTDAVTVVVRGRSASDGPSGGTPLIAPQTPFNGAIEPERSMAFTQISLSRGEGGQDGVRAAPSTTSCWHVRPGPCGAT